MIEIFTSFTTKEDYSVIPRGSTTAATSKMKHFMIIGKGFQPLTIITKCSILDVAAFLDPPLIPILYSVSKL